VELMWRAIGMAPEEGRLQEWRDTVAEAFSWPHAAVFVVDDPDGDGGLAACGAGVTAQRLPNPWHLGGSPVGYVQWMSTDPAFRRRGLARAVLRAVLAWLDAQGIDDVELHASPDGAPLYRSEGFWRGNGGEPMRRRPWDPPPPAGAGP